MFRPNWSIAQIFHNKWKLVKGLEKLDCGNICFRIYDVKVGFIWPHFNKFLCIRRWLGPISIRLPMYTRTMYLKMRAARHVYIIVYIFKRTALVLSIYQVLFEAIRLMKKFLLWLVSKFWHIYYSKVIKGN